MRIHTILVPTDFSDSATAALRWADDLAAACSARIVLLHAVDLNLQWVPAGPAVIPAPVPAAVVRRIREQAGASLDAVAAKTPHVARRLLRSGHARDVILSAANEVKANVIVMGTHGRRGVEHLFLGSVAEYVVRNAPMPVMTVRAPRPAKTGARRGGAR